MQEGGHLAWSKKTHKIALNQPDARKRESGIIVLIDPVYWIKYVVEILQRLIED